MRLIGSICFTVLTAFAQYPPGQYPPGQYPPNTYPPNTYPPNTNPGGYPPNTYPNTYPTRLPGGVPVNLPVPEVKLPKKKDDKSKPEETKLTIVSLDGTLRRLREKDLLLEAPRKAVLRFRLIAKTKFQNKAGEAIRDSLLHPGDQLSVLVNPDDEETALRVILVRAGTAAERAAGEKPVDDTAVREPRPEDFGKPKTITTTAEATHEPIDDAKPPEPAAETETPREPSAPRLNTDDALLTDSRAASANFTSTLPNYLVEQVTVRFFSPSSPARWQMIDQVTAELAYVDGKEDYRNFRIDGRPIDRPEQSGSWSTGEFSTTLQDILAPATAAHFVRRGDAKFNGRAATVFNYTVAQSNSHWTLVSPDERRFNPAFEGAVWIDQDTRRILKIEQRTSALPRDWPIKSAESTLEYGFFKIEGKTYLLPATAENIGCMSGSGACTRNTIEFRNYRKFTTESNVRFDKQ